MKYGRMIAALLLSAVMIVCCMSTAFALDGIDGNIHWVYDDTTKTLTLSRRSGSSSGTMTDYTGGHYPAWWNLREYIRNVVIAGDVTNVSPYAFWLHSALQTVTISEGVTSIDSYAFLHCKALEGVLIPDSVKTIGNSSFFGDIMMKSVLIPTGVTSIGSYAFENCRALNTVIFTGTKTTWDGVAKGEYVFGFSVGSSSHKERTEANALTFRFKPAVRSVSFGADVTINCKKSATLQPVIDAENPNYTVSYSSSDPKIVSVDPNSGEVYGAKKGVAVITCTATDDAGNTEKANCKVTVQYSFAQWLIVILLFGWIWY